MSQAQQTIDKLKAVFVNDRFQFDFAVSQYIAGDGKKKLRQEIAQLVTGQQIAFSKCSMYAVSDMLMAKFQQTTLF